MLAALLASLMSTLTSVFNSASSIVTLDLWKQIRKGAKQAELMIVGRITVLVMVGISILWLPVLQGLQGGLLWFYIAAITAYLSVPWCMAFLLGLFWKRTSEPVGILASQPLLVQGITTLKYLWRRYIFEYMVRHFH